MFAGNGLDGNGKMIAPPIVTVSDFKGGVVPNEEPVHEKPTFDLSKLRNFYLGTGLNDFGPKKDTNKDDLQFISVKDEKPSIKVDVNSTISEKTSHEFSLNETNLPNTGGGDNEVLNALGALTLASVLGFAVTKREFENE